MLLLAQVVLLCFFPFLNSSAASLDVIGKACAKLNSVFFSLPKKRRLKPPFHLIPWDLKGLQAAGEKDFSRQAQQLNLLLFDLKDRGD